MKKTLSKHMHGNSEVPYNEFGQTISVKWVSDHGEEQKLPGLPYSPKQLFWVSLYHQSKASEELRASK